MEGSRIYTSKGSTSGGQVCPKCGSSIIQGVNYCYKCNSFLDPTGNRVLEFGEVTDKDIECLVEMSRNVSIAYKNNPKKVKERKNIYIALGVALTIATVGQFLGAFASAVLLIGAVAVFIQLIRSRSSQKPPVILELHQFRSLVSKYIVPSILSPEFDGIQEYDPEGYISDAMIDSSGLIYREYTCNSGSQYMRGVYKGFPLEISNITLEKIVTNYEGRQEDLGPAFDGIWMIYNMGQIIPEDIRIMGKYPGYTFKNKILTNYAEFDKRFFVACNDPELVHTILSPSVMNTILQMDDLVKGRLFINLMKDGQVCIGIDSARRFLMVRDVYEPIPHLRERLREDTKYPLMLLDILRKLV